MVVGNQGNCWLACCWLAALSLSALAVGCQSTNRDARDDSRDMAGRWSASKAELSGAKLADELRESLRLVVENGRCTVTTSRETEQGTLVLNTAHKPKAMDITGTDGPNKGKRILAIYELSDDTLRICCDLAGQARPVEFKTSQGGQLFLVTYTRTQL